MSSGLGSVQGKDPNVKSQLKDARQRAKKSSEALLAELMGSAGATPARYSTWPMGCAVKVAFDEPMHLGGSHDNDDENDSLLATLVKYDKAQNTFDVKLHDGSLRTVPANRVSRARARDRTRGQATLVEQAPEFRAAGKGYTVTSAAVVAQEALQPQSQQPPGLLCSQPDTIPGYSSVPEPQMMGRVQLAVES